MTVDFQTLGPLVQAHCIKTQQLRKAEDQLCWDLLLVLRSARPAFLLDYAFVPREPLVQLLKAVNDAFQEQCALLSWGSNCHMVCNLPFLLEKLQLAATPAASSTCPIMLEVRATEPGADGPAASIHVLTEDDCNTLLSSLAPLEAALSRQRLIPGVASVALHKLPGLPLMPTLNGWLLGYPVIYVVHSMEGSQLAARYLSMHDITLFQVRTSALARQHGAESSMSPAGPLFRSGATLSSFSIPTHLLQCQEPESSGDQGPRALQEGEDETGHTCSTTSQAPLPRSQTTSRAAGPHAGEASKGAEHRMRELAERIDAWAACIREGVGGDGWGADVSCVREDRGLQTVSL